MLDKKIDTILDLQNVKFKTRAKMRGTDSSSTSNSRWCTLHYYFLLNVSLLRIEQLNGFTLSQVMALRKNTAKRGLEPLLLENAFVRNELTAKLLVSSVDDTKRDS